MLKEIDIAARWWLSQLTSSKSLPPLTSQQIGAFQEALSENLRRKYENHWYPK
jgi:hypothetical protein